MNNMLNINNMEANKFRNYERRPCKFIFRNGKEVFGVIWETKKQKNANYLFTSNGEFEKISQKSKPINGLPVRLEDLIHAELL